MLLVWKLPPDTAAHRQACNLLLPHPMVRIRGERMHALMLILPSLILVVRIDERETFMLSFSSGTKWMIFIGGSYLQFVGLHKWNTRHHSSLRVGPNMCKGNRSCSCGWRFWYLYKPKKNDRRSRLRIGGPSCLMLLLINSLDLRELDLSDRIFYMGQFYGNNSLWKAWLDLSEHGMGV